MKVGPTLANSPTRSRTNISSFTAPELRELAHLEHTDVYFNTEEIKAAIGRAGANGEIEKHTASNLEAMRTVAEKEKANHERAMEFLFLFAENIFSLRSFSRS